MLWAFAAACAPDSYVEALLEWQNGQRVQFQEIPGRFEVREASARRFYVKGAGNGFELVFVINSREQPAKGVELAEANRGLRMALLVATDEGGVMAESGTVSIEVIAPEAGSRVRGRIDEASIPAIPPRFESPGKVKYMRFSGRVTERY